MRRLWPSLAVVSVALATGACVSEVPPALPSYDLPIGPASRARADEDLGIASPSSGSTVAFVASIDLPSALAACGARSVEVRYAEAKVDEARQGIYAAWGSLFPTFTPGLAFHAHRDALQRSTGQFVDVTKQQEFAGAAGLIRWEPGAAILKGLAAARRTDAAEAATETARANTALAVAEGYFSLVRARALVAIAQQALQESEELYRDQDDREKKGAGLTADVKRAEAQVAQSELLKTQAEVEVAVASARLASLLQLTPNVELTPIDPAPLQLFLVSPDKPFSELLDKAETSRPELRESAALISAAQHDLENAKWGPLIPGVDAGFASGTLGPTLGQGDDTTDYVAGVGWKIGPGGLFDLPAINANAARVKQERIRLEGLRAEIARQVVEARARVAAADKEVASAAKGVAAAQEALRLSTIKFQKGTGIILEVLDAQAALTRAQTSQVEAIVHFDQAQYRLLRAIGEPIEAMRAPR